MGLLERYRAAFRGLSREVWLLSAVALINRSGSMVVPFLTLYLTSSRDCSPSEAGRILALYGLGSLLGVTAGGRLADRWSHRATMAASLFCSGVMLLVVSQLQEMMHISIGVLVLGLVSEALRPATLAAIATYAQPHERARAYGLNRLALNLGWSIGPPLGGLLAAFGYVWLFVLDGLTCMAAGAFLLLALPKREAARSEARGEAVAERMPWRDGPYLILLFCLFLQALVFFQIHSTLPLFLTEERGLKPSGVGLLLAVNTVLIVLFEMLVVHRAERYRALSVLAIAALFVGAGFGVLPWATTVPVLVFSVLLWTVGEMLFAPLLSSWIANRAGEGSRGRYMAGMGVAFSIASMLAPVLGTWTYEQFGSNVLWGAGLGLGVASCLGVLMLQRSLRDEPLAG